LKRGQTGRYETTSVEGETVRAFVPAPLPPVPPLELVGKLYPLLERALLALGRLDSVTRLLPGTDLFLYTYVRKEAVLSSQIEGTQSSLSDLLLFELDELPGVPLNDVQEVSNYVAALQYGVRRLREDFPLSSRLIREIHQKLLAKGRGSGKSPGQFRRSQNWIGGTRPGTAAFVPPPHGEVAECMSDLEKFIHRGGNELPVVVQAGLIHVQFETIHPFLDGNGRIGRLLITLQLCSAGILHEPLLYLSLYFKQHRSEYYRLLDAVRKEGDWEEWLRFFLGGVAATAEGAVATAQRIVSLFEKHHSDIRKAGRQAGSLLRVHEALKQRPICTIAEAAKRSDLSFPTAATAMESLVASGIARELTGKKRNRIFVYDKYLAALSEGTEPLSF
jgi:Fic family protein